MILWPTTSIKKTSFSDSSVFDHHLSSVSQDEFPVTDEFPVVDEFPSVLKWRRKPSVVSVSSSLPDLLGNSTGSLSPADAPFKSEQLLEGDKTLDAVSSHGYEVQGFTQGHALPVSC